MGKRYLLSGRVQIVLRTGGGKHITKNILKDHLGLPCPSRGCRTDACCEDGEVGKNTSRAIQEQGMVSVGPSGRRDRLKMGITFSTVLFDYFDPIRHGLIGTVPAVNGLSSYSAYISGGRRCPVTV
jgi:hypothetical protein